MARFEEISKYTSSIGKNKNQIKLYFTRKNKIKNILENTSSSIVKLDDSILNFAKTEKVIL